MSMMSVLLTVFKQIHWVFLLGGIWFAFKALLPTFGGGGVGGGLDWLKNKLDGTKENINKLNEVKGAWEDLVGPGQHDIDEADDNIDRIDDDIDRIDDANTREEQADAIYNRVIENTNNEFERIRQTLAEMRNEINRHPEGLPDETLNELRNDINQLRESINRTDDLDAHRDQTLNYIDQLKDAINGTLDDMKHKEEESQKELKDLIEDIKKSTLKKQDANKIIKDLLDENVPGTEELKKTLEEMGAEFNQFNESAKDVWKQVADLGKEIERVRKEVNSSKNSIDDIEKINDKMDQMKESFKSVIQELLNLIANRGDPKEASKLIDNLIKDVGQIEKETSLAKRKKDEVVPTNKDEIEKKNDVIDKALEDVKNKKGQITQKIQEEGGKLDQVRNKATQIIDEKIQRSKHAGEIDKRSRWINNKEVKLNRKIINKIDDIDKIVRGRKFPVADHIRKELQDKINDVRSNQETLKKFEFRGKRADRYLFKGERYEMKENDVGHNETNARTIKLRKKLIYYEQHILTLDLHFEQRMGIFYEDLERNQENSKTRLMLMLKELKDFKLEEIKFLRRIINMHKIFLKYELQ
ncbi:hypothetical protein ACFL1H_01430 [Nanoarchaeota archaeon]